MQLDTSEIPIQNHVDGEGEIAERERENPIVIVDGSVKAFASEIFAISWVQSTYLRSLVPSLADIAAVIRLFTNLMKISESRRS